MKHLGDITKLSGYTLPIVDVITGGSPCQDLSVAGKRAGLAGERSGLFMEQMRIVKEMRERERATGRTGWMVRPRYMVWENVDGARTSPGGNRKGADFAAVIEEIIKVAEPGTAVSVCVPNGGWTKSGCYYAEDGSWSVAWRVHDAQFWGVPQRRKRISLVADFGGLSAPEILFERKGLSGDSEPCGEDREGASSTVEGSADGAEYFGLDQQGGKGGANYTIGVAPTLAGDSHGTPHGVAYGISSYDSNAMKSSNPHSGIYEADTARTLDLNGGSPACNQGGIAVVQSAVYDARGNGDAVFCLQGNGIGRSDTAGCSGKCWREDVSYTLNTIDRPAVAFGCDVYNQEITGDVAASLTAASGGSNTSGPKVIERQESAVYDARGNGNGQANQSVSDKAGALNTMHDQQAVLIAMASTAAHAEITTDGVSPSLLARAGTGGNNMPNITRGSTVRRLTPMECERLQGYPDGWTDIGEWVDSKGKKHKDADSPRYKALGNSIALPFWQWMARRICAQYERTITMASLFDGIGGFPLVFQRCGAVPVWASEIEEFPIAVTRVRFAEEDGGVNDGKDD